MSALGLVNSLFGGLKKAKNKFSRFGSDETPSEANVPLTPRPPRPFLPASESTPDVEEPDVPSPYGVALGPRPEINAPQSEYERLSDLGRRLGTKEGEKLDEYGNTIKKPGRLRAGLKLGLENIGDLARQNMANGRTSWTDVAGLGGAAAGGFGAGVASPNILVKRRHAEAVDKNRQMQQDEIGRETNVAKIEGVRAEAQRDRAYAESHTPAALKAQADAKLQAQNADDYDKAVKSLNEYAHNGAEPEYVQGLATELEKKFGKPVAVPKYTAKAGSLHSVAPGGSLVDSNGMEVFRNGNLSPIQQEKLIANQDEIKKANAAKSVAEQEVTDAKDIVAKRKEEVEQVDASKPTWDQAAAGGNSPADELSDENKEYIKNYKKDLKDWETRRATAQNTWTDAVKDQKKKESKWSGITVPEELKYSTPTSSASGTHQYTQAQISDAAKKLGISVDEVLKQLKDRNPNANIVVK